MHRLFPAAVLALLLPTAALAQKSLFPELKPYESCSFPDGLQVSDIQPMPADVKERPIQSHGKTLSVPLVAGRRITFSYPGGAAYASVKVEELPEAGWAANRKLLLADFDDIVASDKGVARNITRKPTQSSFSVVGLDRKAVEGNTLGIYMLIDDATRVVSTVYLLNPAKSKIKTIADYNSMRDTFLYNYTRCIRQNQSGSLFGVPK